MKKALYAICIILFISGCTQKYTNNINLPKEKQSQTADSNTTAQSGLIKLKSPNIANIVTQDNRDNIQLMQSIERSMQYYAKISQNTQFNFGDRNISAKRMYDGLAKFKNITQKKQSFEDFLTEIQDNFDIYASINSRGGALITGYYAPIINGSLLKTQNYEIPVYGLPSDYIIAFDANGTKRAMRKAQKDVLPYYTHKEIANGVLVNEKPIFWVQNPAERFFLAVQGSGIVRLENGKELNIGYAGGNGWPYYSIGKYFGDNKLLPSDQISTQSIKDYLSALPYDDAQAILNNNPNFVFFKIQNKKGVFGNIGVELTPFASVAMDSQKIPKGALAFVKTFVPYKTEPEQTSVPKTQREPWQNFVLIQDTGGAITGYGRVDLYCGEGDSAYFYAGQMAERGEVYLFAPKF